PKSMKFQKENAIVLQETSCYAFRNTLIVARPQLEQQREVIMVTRETQLPLCPVCHKADKVKKLETAYNEGLERFAPPPMPGKTVSVVRYMVSSMILVGLFIYS